jgi:hypothetical protein
VFARRHNDRNNHGSVSVGVHRVQLGAAWRCGTVGSVRFGSPSRRLPTQPLLGSIHWLVLVAEGCVFAMYMYRPDLRAALTTLLSCPLSSRTLLKRTNKRTTSQSADETRELSSVGFDAASSRRNVRVVATLNFPDTYLNSAAGVATFWVSPSSPAESNPTQPNPPMHPTHPPA